jgi:hypothetical protein
MLRSKKHKCAAGSSSVPQGSLLSSLINAGQSVSYACKVSGDCGMIAVTENVRTHLGYAPEEFLADPGFWAVHIHAGDSIRVFDEMPRLFERGEETMEYRFLHADGRYVWLRDDMQLKLDASGQPDRIMGRWTDVTGLKLAAASAAQLMSPRNGTTETRGEGYAKQT